MERNKEEKNEWIDDIAMLVLVIFLILLGACGAKWFYWDFKMDAKDSEIEELKNKLSQYTVTDDALLPCPWCKSEDVELHDTLSNNHWCVRCNNCGAYGPVYKYDEYTYTYSTEYLTREEAFKIWNNFRREEK